MDIRSACARVGGSSNEARKLLAGNLSEEVIAAMLAKEAAEVAKISGITKHEVHYESVGAHDGQQQTAEGPCLADIGPKYLKSKEHRHWYTVGQSGSYYAALVAQQHDSTQQPSSPQHPTPAMLLQRVLQQNTSLAVREPGSARSSSSSTLTLKPALEQEDC